MSKKLPMIILSTTIITVSAALFVLRRKSNNEEFHIKSYDGKFDIMFNNEWKLSKTKNELNENSNLEAINSKNGICFIMFSKAKYELNNISLDEYNDSILSSIKGENIIASNKIIINNKNIYMTEFDSYYENMLIHYLLYTLETENYYHQIMAALINNNLKNDYKKQCKQINDILYTIREL
ncbi:hypothetical protein [Brachyspira sp.]|uniref:hypothetical protein n=1 Tax=Brachyspira sp. TaxID=1977261 RepID=UPI00262E7ADA|nr:hypothetical protein [Brachyspira sp.]